MCFSATASFVAAAATGAAELAAMSLAGSRKELAIAAIPIVFSVQQTIEGALWMTLPVAPESAASSLLTWAFLLLAKVFWPLYVPMAVLLAEKEPVRRKLLMVLYAAGASVALFFLASIFTNAHKAHVLGGHIAYSDEPHLPLAVGIGYLAATGIAPMLSSRRGFQLLGLVVTAGSLVAYHYYWEAFVSVWCFFAAAGSAVILAEFERARRTARTA